ncbi:MAG: patatin-like phospholipase family protein [Burkholderiales bacterium]|nr:patatin-like phospholipase family protein [Burkholderiales bacterium]
MRRAFVVKLGRLAREAIARDGLRPGDIACVPAAAGGPKGLALMPLDRWLFGEWLAQPRELTLVGASIGAWRMAAAADANPVAAIAALERGYVEDQNFRVKPTPAEVAQLMRANVENGFAAWRPRPDVTLHVLTARAAGALERDGSRRAFGRAALANARGRRHLSRHLRRVVFSRGPARGTAEVLFGDDPFGCIQVDLDAANATQALLASGSIPLVSEAVPDIPGAPAGWYWDGGLIDYHLYHPYARLDRLTLYPHFAPSVTPGWLDKFLPWRKQGVRGRGAPWLASMILIAPSPAFIATLPGGKLPDRNDFYRYAGDHAARIAAWKRALAECRRFADEAAAWLTRPDLSIAESFEKESP